MFGRIFFVKTNLIRNQKAKVCQNFKKLDKNDDLEVAPDQWNERVRPMKFVHLLPFRVQVKAVLQNFAILEGKTTF